MAKAVLPATLLLVLLAGCSLNPGQPQYVRGYRLVDARTLSVLADTSTGLETWVASVVETPTSVTVEVRRRVTDPRPGAPVAEDIWLTVTLGAPLGNREVIDAVTNRAVEARP